MGQRVGSGRRTDSQSPTRSHDLELEQYILTIWFCYRTGSPCERHGSRATLWTRDEQVLRKKAGVSVLVAREQAPSLPIVF